MKNLTPYEKFLAALIGLYLLAHLTYRLGVAAGIPASAVSLAESMITP